MKVRNSFIKKTCSFYASEYHLVTMLLPHIIQNVEENIEIKTFLQEELNENVDNLVGVMNIEKLKQKIMKNITWNSKNGLNYNMIKKELDKCKDRIINLIVSGNYNYVEQINQYIKKWLMKNDRQFVIEINNCYMIEPDLNYQRVISKHECILNTSGETKINSIFEFEQGASNF
ncbi:MAG: hypothetical protein FWF46_08750 [Oscillospiraceae bacterium]|nr:hypothetical protein [Oscillospiraceae bacterium]